MGIFSSGSEVERAVRKAADQRRKAAEKQRREQERAERDRARQQARYLASPPGQARTSHQRGDTLFQVSIDLEDIESHVVEMDNAYTSRHATDVSEILNAIVVQGWDMHSMSTTFVNEGDESSDRFLASGQQVAVRGRLVGTYVFTRKPGRNSAA